MSEQIRDYSKLVKLVLTSGTVIEVAPGSYSESRIHNDRGMPVEVFSCKSQGQNVVGLGDHIIAMWFSQELDN